MARLAINSQNKMANMITHDVYSAICYIPALVDMVKEQKGNPHEVEKLVDMITYSENKSMKSLDDFLLDAKSLSKDIVYRFETFDFSELTNSVIAFNKLLASIKNQKIESSVKANIVVNVDRTRLSELIDNLLSNAIKYSPREKNQCNFR